MREQLHGEKVVAKMLYPGRRSGIDPVEYLMEHYGEDIKLGRLGPGRLFNIDAGLYTSVHERLKSANPPTTITAFFAAHTAEDKRGTAGERRMRALATILQTSQPEAARFLQNVRPSRLLFHDNNIKRSR
ncbi:MAG TPA: hypothetical protein VMH86_06315 [Rhizomicrobium sp.]|nr:hypothetical protein [Rhizomicrobium sp.]